MDKERKKSIEIRKIETVAALPEFVERSLSKPKFGT